MLWRSNWPARSPVRWRFITSLRLISRLPHADVIARRLRLSFLNAVVAKECIPKVEESFSFPSLCFMFFFQGGRYYGPHSPVDTWGKRYLRMERISQLWWSWSFTLKRDKSVTQRNFWKRWDYHKTKRNSITIRCLICFPLYFEFFLNCLSFSACKFSRGFWWSWPWQGRGALRYRSVGLFPLDIKIESFVHLIFSFISTQFEKLDM